MKFVRQLLEDKGHDIVAISPDSSVLAAIRLMADRSIGALVVTEHGRLVGIVSERDYARKVILKGRSAEDTPVRDIMTRDVVTAGCGDSVRECMNTMTVRRIRHQPVVDDGELKGVISIGDLVKAIIADQQQEIEQLEQYISS